MSQLPTQRRSYEARPCLAAALIGVAKRGGPGSISAAIAEYYDSRAFKSFASGTLARRRNVLEKFRDQHGHLSLASLPGGCHWNAKPVYAALS
jgi:hypothetical protein